ncbi:hypothetical protein ACN47E_001080 [Coniothyrium glycines]
MVYHEPTRNTYEEVPDEAKEWAKITAAEYGQSPKSLSSRETLLSEHERHLALLTDGILRPRVFVLPPQYCPAPSKSDHCNAVHVNDLRISSRSSSEILLLRAVTTPYVYSSTITIVEDAAGNTARLMACNLEDSLLDSIITKGSILLLKQPCWTKAADAVYHIRVDHPSDLTILDPHDTRIPSSWRQPISSEGGRDLATLRREGDMMFLKKKFFKARKFYDDALSNSETCPDNDQRIDLFRKHCGVNLVLLRFDEAARDLAQAVALQIASPSHVSSDLVDTADFEYWLHDPSVDHVWNGEAPLAKPLTDLAARIKYDLGIHQLKDSYDLMHFASCVGPLNMHVDAANYICDTLIKQTTNRGRGLYARRAFRTGDLIMAEKAFALPGYFFNDASSECSLYSLGDGTATDRAGALLFKELVQKLRHNPSLRRQFFDMDDGGYWRSYGWYIEDGDDIPVDIFRIEHIRRRNCFSAPLRSSDLIKFPAPVRNGFWIHTSYINHDCLPNSVRTFIGDLLLLRATRDISEGEEITAQYLAPDLVYAERQKNIYDTWQFRCECKLCELDKAIGKDIESQRMTIFEELKEWAQKLGEKPTVTALKKFAKRLRDLEALYDEEAYAGMPRLCLVHPTLYLTEAWRTLNHTEKMIESATKLLTYFGILTEVDEEEFSVLKNTGLVNIECVRALKYLAEGYDVKGKTALAEQIRSHAKVWFRVITGADVGCEEFLRLN